MTDDEFELALTTAQLDLYRSGSAEALIGDIEWLPRRDRVAAAALANLARREVSMQRVSAKTLNLRGHTSLNGLKNDKG